jgi:TolB protein
MFRLAALALLGSACSPPVTSGAAATSRLIFLAEDPTTPEQGALVAMRPDGSERASLLRGANIFPAAVDPTGAWLAVVAVDEQGGAHLERIRVYALTNLAPSATLAAPVWESPPATQVRNPSFRPDGRALAFESAVASFRDIYRVELPGGPLLRLTDDEEGNYEPAFAPDGSAITFVSSRDGNAEIYRMNPDGGDPRRLTSSPLDDWGPQWSPDAQTIAFLSNREQIDRVFLMRPDGGDLRRLTDDRSVPPGPDTPLGNEPHETEPVFAPDGQSIVHGVRSGPKGTGLRLTPIAGGKSIELSDGQASDRNPVWSPDGNFVVFVSDHDGGDLELYRIGRDGQGRARLTERPGADWLPRFSPR